MMIGAINNLSQSESNNHLEPVLPPMLRGDWLSFTREILAEVVATYARYGAMCAPTLQVVFEGGLMPCYNIEQGQIECYLPDPTTDIGRLFWLYYQNLCGGADLYDTQAMIECYLPLVIAHEVAHHLRFRYDRLAKDQWREEEIVQMMAMSLIASHPRFASLLPQLKFFTYRMACRLAQIVRTRRQNNTETLETEIILNETRLEELIEIGRFNPDHSLFDIISKADLLNRDKLSGDLTSLSTGKDQMDMINYWLAGLIWTLPHLERGNWPPLSELIDKFILSAALEPHTE